MAAALLLPAVAGAGERWEWGEWHQLRRCRDDPPRVVVVGDSISEDPTGWVTMVAQARPDLTVVNTACAGCSLRDVLSYAPAYWPRRFGGIWRYEVEPALPADLFVFAFGANGATGFEEPVPIEVVEWESLYREILGEANAPAILISPNTFFGEFSPFNDRLEQYQQIVYRVASETPWVEVADPNGVLVAEDYPASGSGIDIHPGPTGDRKIADAVLRRIDGVLPVRERR